MTSLNENVANIPVAPLKIAALEGCQDLAGKVNKHLVDIRRKKANEHKGTIEFKGYESDTYLVDCSCPRFGTGEAKGTINESVRGVDLFVMADVGNYSVKYTVCGHENHMSPDDHYQDMKRIVSTAMAPAKRVTAIMPFLYEGRQHKRSQRESLDSALSLQELTDMGVSSIITFDAHDPRIVNAIPLYGFDNYMPPFQFIKAILEQDKELKIDNEHLMIISPDEGSMSRAVYFSNVLGVDMGMFYKRRDYSVVINGKNPIVAHEFLGTNVKGKDVIVVDDMISSGESILDVAKQVKSMGAKKVIVCTTFGLFTDGFDKFDEYYKNGYINYVVTTNLVYRKPELLEKPYYVEADMSRYLALIIDTINHDASVESVIDPTDKIRKLVEEYYKEEQNEAKRTFN